MRRQEYHRISAEELRELWHTEGMKDSLQRAWRRNGRLSWLCAALSLVAIAEGILILRLLGM